MSKSKTCKAPAGAKAASKQIMVITYAVFAFRNGGGMKTPIESEDAGRAILKEIYVCSDKDKPYLNEERGLFFHPSELSHAYLAKEQQA